MTSKTFKNRVSVRDAESVLEITDTPAGVRFTVSEEDRIVSGWFNPDQGAEIALATLESAGYTDSSKGGIIDKVSNAMFLLKEHVKKQERSTAEARERAELEAEALELVNAHREATGNPLAESLDGLLYNAKETWLAVARRAREMRAEK